MMPTIVPLSMPCRYACWQAYRTQNSEKGLEPQSLHTQRILSIICAYQFVYTRTAKPVNNLLALMMHTQGLMSLVDNGTASCKPIAVLAHETGTWLSFQIDKVVVSILVGELISGLGRLCLSSTSNL